MATSQYAIKRKTFWLKSRLDFKKKVFKISKGVNVAFLLVFGLDSKGKKTASIYLF